MSGWVFLIALMVLAITGLWLLKMRGAMLKLAAAALLVGAAGYALQGRPGVAGSPRLANARQVPIPLTAARRAFFGEFTAAEHWLIISESLARRGKTADAVNLLRSATRQHPRDPALWVGLGNALVDHARVLTPAGELAFARATDLAPAHPAAPFFLGLALARSGDRQGAITLWRRILADAPADASWRPLVEDALAALEAGGR